MAIIIPQDKIYNYNFNILQNNFINKISANITNNYNLGDIVIDVTGDGLNNWVAASWNENVLNASIGRSGSASTTLETTINGNNAWKTFDSLVGNIQLRTPQYYTKDISKLISNITIEVTYNDDSVESSDASFSYLEDVTRYWPSNFDSSVSNLGVFVFNTKTTNESKYYFNYEFRVFLLDRIDQESGNTTTLYKYVKNCKITITPQLYEEKTDYIYEIEDNEYNNFEYSNSSMFNKEVGIVEYGMGNSDYILTPIHTKIFENIVENYKNGKMTLEIETRYTTFKDSDGNDINNGKPYLIKVGDILRPEMTNKFKDFQYEYVVTSAEYEYNGSDKVYLKLLQI